MSQVDVDSGIENMEVEDSDRREKRNLTEKVNGTSEYYAKERQFYPVFLGLFDFDRAIFEINGVFKWANIKTVFSC